MARQIERIEISPMTPEEREQMRVALDRADRIRDAILAKRDRRLFLPARDDIAAFRKERERELP